VRRTDAADFEMALASLERAALRGLARFLSVPRPDQLPVLGSDVAVLAPIPRALGRLLGSSEARTFASSGDSESEGPAPPRQPQPTAAPNVVHPKSYEEVEDEIYEMAEDLLPNIHKPLYNVWDLLPEDERGIVEYDEASSAGGDGMDQEIGDLIADLYEEDQWSVEDEIGDAERAMEGHGLPGGKLERVTDLKDTIFQWEYYLVLHPLATALPRHPKNDKVRLTVQLENLSAYHGLTEAQKSHIALICGPRYTSKTDSILLTTQAHRSRVDNQKHLMKIVQDLVDEARAFAPSQDAA